MRTIYSYIVVFIPCFFLSFYSSSQDVIQLKYPIEKPTPILEETVISVDELWQWRKDLMMGIQDSGANQSTQKFRFPFEFNKEEEILIYPVGLSFDRVMQQDGVNIMKTDTTFFCNLSQSNFLSNEIVFKIPSNGEWTNIDLDSVFMRLESGMEWQRLLPEESLVFNSEDFQNNLLVSFRFYSEGRIFQSQTSLKGLQCQSIFPSPQLPPWPATNTSLPWEITVETEWGLVRANAYTLLSQDQVFDMPFIFVEGIDFGNQHGYYQHGTFGWCQFTGGDYSGNYAMMNESPVFLSELRSQGYDIILLDFFDGATDIRANAEVLIELISLCNQFKQGAKELVLAGASMGGQVARCALGKLEQQEEPHCVGVYISLDSPHSGANIPLGLQAALSYLATYNANAEEFIDQALNRPAAQQLLIYHWLDSEGNVEHPWKREEYVNYLSSIPFPSQCFSMAIANGNFQNQFSPCNSFLLEENCDASVFLSGNELEIRAFTLPGDLTNTANTGAEVVIADMTYTTFGWNGIIPDFTQDHQLLMVPSGLPSLDCAPGGYRTSVAQLVSTLNESADFTNSCGVIADDQYLSRHCFVPSPSAWGVNLDCMDMESAWLNTPFDAVYSPYNQNEQHSALTAQNAEWVLNQLLTIDEDGNPLNLSPAAIYNFGGNEDLVFPMMDIHGNQKISIQKQIPLHGGTLPPPLLGSHQEMLALPNCEGSQVVLHDKAVLEIGDENGVSTATLIIRSGVTLDIYDKGTCWIHKGSRLIIENGGRVRIHGEGGLRNLGGILEIREGGEVIYESGYCSLEKEESRALLKGGLVHLVPESQLNWTPNENESGSIWVYPNDYPEFFFEPGAEMSLRGQGSQDTVLRLLKQAHCSDVSYLDNHVKIREGQVILENSATCQWHADVTLHDMNLLSLPNQGVVNWFTIKNRVDVYDSHFENIKWESTSSNVQLFDVKSEGVDDWNFSHGKFYYLNGQWVGHGAAFHDMLGTTSLSNVILTGEGNSLGIHHSGTDTLIVSKVQISDYISGIIKQQGVVKVKCTELSQLVKGMHLMMGAKAILNNDFGQNEFINNDLHIWMEDSPAPQLLNGGNYFSWATGGPYVSGSCSVFNEYAIDWSGNQWQPASFSGNFQVWNFSNGNMFSIQIEPQIDFEGCTSDELWALKKGEADIGLIFPNPACSGESIFIQKARLVAVMDASGRPVPFTFSLNSLNAQLECLPDLAPGWYCARYENRTEPFIVLP